MKYNVPIEVTEPQYDVLKNQMAGVIAHRKSNGKFYIKIMIGGYNKEIKQIIDKF